MIIEFPDLIPEPEIPKEEANQENGTEPIPDNPNTRTNFASNRSATENTSTSMDEFFDDAYLKELEAAKQLVSDVNKNLAKEIVDLGDIKMPTQTTEGMEPDSIKNVIYSGESNIVYYLENRHHISIANPIYLAQGGGTVIVDIKVNRSGKVTEAIARRNNSIRDLQILLYAREAALRTVFNAETSAPEPQRGTIHYTFVAQ